MAKRVISTSIQLDNEAEFKRQMSAVNSELRTLKTEMAYNEAVFKGQANSVEALTAKDKLLRQEIEQQQEKVRALEKAVEDTNDAYEAGDKRADAWRQSLNQAKTDLLKMNRELQDTDRYLDEAKGSADHCAGSIDEFGREVKDAFDDIDSGGGLNGLLDSLGNLKGLLAGGAAGLGLAAVKELGEAVMNVEESTREYRSAMGALEGSSKQAGYTTEQTSKAYDHLYGVLGDAQTTATALSNLQAVGLTQKDLMVMLDATTGAWAKYGDSIPIDSLAESINETARAGTVTGTFADVLNWGAAEGETYGVKLREGNEANKEWNEAVNDAKTAEDYFNLALSECSTQTERADLILKTMAEQGLIEAGQGFRDLNGDIIKANNSENDLEKAWGALGEKLEPVASFFRETLAGAINATTQAVQGAYDFVGDLITVFSDLNEKINNWIDSWDFSGVYNWIGKINDRMKDTQWGDGTIDKSLESFTSKVDAIPHANGLNWVPYDGYLAELHQGEAVLTAQENRIWQQFREAGRQSPTGVTAAELQTMLVGTVNALGSQQAGGIPREITLRLKADDGQVMGRWLVPFVRSEDRSNPEVVSDT